MIGRREPRAWARRPNGLTVPFDVPLLAMADSIGRSCAVADGGILLTWKPPEYMITHPLPGFTVDSRGTVYWSSW